MKKLKNLLLILVMLFMFPLVVKAEDNMLEIEAPEMASKGDEITVKINLTTALATNEFKGTLTFESTVLELLNVESKESWKQESKFSKESPAALDFSREESINGKSTVATVKFLVKKDVAKNTTSISIEGTSKTEDGTITTLEKKSSNIDIKSTDNTLKSLKFNNESILNFSPTVYGYKQTVDSTVTIANFEAELNDNTATYKEGYEPKTGESLNYGDNVFEIVVVSAAGQELTYTVTIVREDNRGSDNSLAELIVNGNKNLLEFKKDQLDYTVVTHKLETVDIYAKASDSKAKIDIDKPETLLIGENTVTITVTSEKNEEKVYKITVKNSDKEIDTSLKSLEIFGLDEDIEFQKDVYDYVVLYKAKYKEDNALTINYTVNNPEEAVVNKDGYKSDLEKLGPGKKVTIEVRAKDGTESATSYYTITFKKDNRINFFLLLFLFIFIVLFIIFICLFFRNRKQKKKMEVKEEELLKTKKLVKVIKE